MLHPRRSARLRSRRVRGLVAACVAGPLLCVAALWLPWTTEVRLDVMGDVGTETFEITRNNRLLRVVGPITPGPMLRTVVAECFGPVWNLQIRVTGLNGEPRLFKIKDGVVAVTRRNLFGQVLSSEDWLNIDTRYVGYKHEELYPVESEIMANIRAGYCGVNGQYLLVAPSLP